MALRTVQRSLTGDEPVKPRPPASLSTFQDNLSLPVHRWFRYPAGFSGEWVESLLRDSRPRVQHVFDPFAGTGTTLIAAQMADVESIGVEPHTFVHRVAEAKLLWTENANELRDAAQRVREEVKITRASDLPALLEKCFTSESLQKLQGLSRAISAGDVSAELRKLLWLALAAILRACSPVGTAQWQYVLPNRRKARAAEPFLAFHAQVSRMAEDMRWMQSRHQARPARILAEDSREETAALASWADMVITSPPYPNNYDYADATRLEMTFFGEIEGWGDLQEKVRRPLIRSCSQHVGGADFEELLSSSRLAPIRDELVPAYEKLRAERTRHGGKKPYHSMAVAYFYDLASAWIEIRRATRTGARVCFVIGDSAPYGVYLPVEKWLGQLAVAAGFESFTFEKLRDRNLKWLNRKHRVPLKEGLLWVEG